MKSRFCSISKQFPTTFPRWTSHITHSLLPPALFPHGFSEEMDHSMATCRRLYPPQNSGCTIQKVSCNDWGGGGLTEELGCTYAVTYSQWRMGTWPQNASFSLAPWSSPHTQSVPDQIFGAIFSLGDISFMGRFVCVKNVATKVTGIGVASAQISFQCPTVIMVTFPKWTLYQTNVGTKDHGSS